MRMWREVAASPQQSPKLASQQHFSAPIQSAVEATPDVQLALVHDWLIRLGGADRVLLALHHLFPRAPVFVGLYDSRRLPDAFHTMDIRTSWLQRIPHSVEWHRQLVPIMPFAFRMLDLRGYKVVLSSSHACAKGVHVDRDAIHICYCHTPMRYAWDLAALYRNDLPLPTRPLAGLAQAWLREWDRRTARSVTHFIANSRFVADRIRRHYHRQASVIYPPVDVDYFTPGSGEPEDFFLIVSRLVHYKRVDIAIETFNALGLPLVVVGDGPEMPRLRALAKTNISLVGEVSDEAVRDYYRRCRALIFPGEEDFGIVPVEAQACGRPVIAYNGGGVRETVIDGQTGLFFPEQSVPALSAAVRHFEGRSFDARAARLQAERFSSRAFSRRIVQFISRASSGSSWYRLPDAPDRSDVTISH